MGRLLTLWGYIRRYKYGVAVVIFLLTLSFLDENSLWERYKRQVEIGNLHREIDKFQAQYEAETAQLQALENNPEAVERLAREKYLMKREREDLFVFMDASDYQVQTAARQRAEDEALPAEAVADTVAGTAAAAAADSQAADSTAVNEI